MSNVVSNVAVLGRRPHDRHRLGAHHPGRGARRRAVLRARQAGRALTSRTGR